MEKFDVVVIGGGPGGYVAAIRAAQLGMKTALVEGEHLGGVCLNWGCIPTKSLLKSSHLFQTAHHLRSFGIDASQVVGHITEMVQRSRDIAQQLAKGVEGLLRQNKVTTYKGWAKVGDLTADGREIHMTLDSERHDIIKSRSTILATGGQARQLFPENLGVWTAKEAMIPQFLPESLLIIGAGAIGVEFASFYQSLGSQVTLVEQADNLLPMEDEDIRRLAHKALTAQGIKILSRHTVSALEKQGEQFVACLMSLESDTSTQWTGRQVLTAVGISGNVTHLGLEKTKVKIHQSHIVTYEYSRTDEPDIYAIGDVAGAPWLAHKASHEGVICAEHLAGHKVPPLDFSSIPSCVYSSPQIASVGLTEAKASESHRIKVGRFPFMGNGQALAQGEKEGLVKVIFDADSGELLGAHMIGQGVTELIQGFVIAKSLEATEEALKRVIFPHPSLSEMMHEAVLDADGESLHFFRKSK
jgi:dihydrolipoamide dehydrogenase